MLGCFGRVNVQSLTTDGLCVAFQNEAHASGKLGCVGIGCDLAATKRTDFADYKTDGRVEVNCNGYRTGS